MKTSEERIVSLKREQLRKTYPKLWMAKYHHRNVHNEPMEFTGKFQFLLPFYKLKYREMCFEKSVQCGISEFLIVSALYEASIGLRILYVMPNIDLRGKFVKDRIDKLLKIVEYYERNVREAVGSSTAIGLKHFGEGILNFVGSNSVAEFISYPADSLYIDEVDRCDQSNLEMAPDRLDNSEYKLIRRVGNPLVENWGIDAAFQDSSQAFWNLKCGACNKWNEIDFFNHLVRKTGSVTFKLRDKKNEPYIVCEKCGKRINRMKKGEWVEKYPSVERKGFRISQLFSANVTLESLVRQYDKAVGNSKKLQIFMNSKLGLPFSSEGSKISFALLERASIRQNYILDSVDLIEGGFVYVGIDVGPAYFHVVVRKKLSNNMRKMIYAGKIEKVKQLILFLKSIKGLKYVVIDEMPEQREVENIKKANNRVLSCLYIFGRTLLDIRKASQEYKKERRIKIDRTFLLDCVMSDFTRGLVINPTNAKDICNEEVEEYGEYYEQMMSSTRIWDEDAGRGKGAFIWRESGADHFFHAEAYCKLAELIDSNVIRFYTDRVSEYAGKTKEEIDRGVEKEKSLIPKLKTGEYDTEQMKLMSAEGFLRNLFVHTEELLGQKREDDE